jgi:hypothetical protein
MYGQQSAIPAGAAIYLATGYSRGGWYVYPFTVSAGGVTTFQAGESYYNGSAAVDAWQCRSVGGFNSGSELTTAMNEAVVVDLAGIIPRLATEATLLVSQFGTTTTDHGIWYEARNYVNETGNATANPYAAAANAHCGEALVEPITIPWSPSSGNTNHSTSNARIVVPIGWAASRSHTEYAGDPDYHLRFIIRRFTKDVMNTIPSTSIRLLGWKT